MRADPSRDGLDFGTLEDPRPRPFLVILDAGKLETFSGWLSLVIACALNALFRREIELLDGLERAIMSRD